MQDDATRAAPRETGALIDHSLSICHQAHRADLAALVPLAKRVERVHAGDPAVPAGLAGALAARAREIEAHMAKEERILFPAMRAGAGTCLAHPIAAMRADHDDHAGAIGLILRLTDDLTPPAHACGSRRALYGGAATPLDEPAAHIALENQVLFPRFEPAG